jgi:hypothetical protein
MGVPLFSFSKGSKIRMHEATGSVNLAYLGMLAERESGGGTLGRPRRQLYPHSCPRRRRAPPNNRRLNSRRVLQFQADDLSAIFGR